ncbi:MAG: hypothetical protein L0332_02375 [Chloroflexi bacterium]|nr:hypothetical protein [Chloroflexota bacterium]MCI0725559.1 hypothetical protein [Chloroflexota bacterium]
MRTLAVERLSSRIDTVSSEELDEIIDGLNEIVVK